jgi:hypothetical protein
LIGAAVIAAGVLAAGSAAHATARRDGGLARCGVGQLRFKVETQGENTTAWIGVRISDRGGPCRLSGSLTLAIYTGLHLALVKRNPITVNVSGSLGGSARSSALARSDLVVFNWSNWCGSAHPPPRIVARYKSAAVRSGLNTLPVCIDSAGRSTLTSAGQAFGL